jgi:hypothetical protein
MHIQMSRFTRYACGLSKASCLFAARVCSTVVLAQAVYRCESNGRVAYSHEPCMGAKRVDTTPTQGLDRFSGSVRRGQDVRREETNRALNEAIRPLTGRSHEEAKVLQRRFKLSPTAQAECRLLDMGLPGQEKALYANDAKSRVESESRLFQSRKRFRELGC